MDQNEDEAWREQKPSVYLVIKDPESHDASCEAVSSGNDREIEPMKLQP